MSSSLSKVTLPLLPSIGEVYFPPSWMWLDLVTHFLQRNVARETFGEFSAILQVLQPLVLLSWNSAPTMGKAKASFLGSEKPHGDREKPSREPTLTSSHMSEAILDHLVLVELPADSCDMSKPKWDQEKNHLSESSPNWRPEVLWANKL